MVKIVIALSALFPMFVGTTSGANQVVGAGVEHRPPLRAVAGDTLDLHVRARCGAGTACPPLVVTANYMASNGNPRTVDAVLSGGAGTAVLTIPGGDVRFPEFAYYLTVTPVGDDPVPLLRVPGDGVHRVDVDNVLRVGFRRPDGAPAAGVRVLARPPTPDMAWTGVTDRRGVAEVTFDESASWLTERAAKDGYSQLFISAFDSVPDRPTDGVVQGYGADVATFVNLGNPVLEAADGTLQDEVLALRPQSRSFTTAGPPHPGCETFPNGYACVELVDRYFNVAVPLADNVGGHAEMTSTYTYSSSTFTSTGVLVKAGAEGSAGAGTGWVEADGETTTESNTEHQSTTGAVGPDANATATAQFNFVRERETWCMGLSCSTSERVRPEVWNLGFDKPSSAGQHGTATQMTAASNSDCVVKIAAATTSQNSKGQKLRFSISIGGTAYGLNARTRYSNETGTTVRSVQTWQVVGTAYAHHHLFVKRGIADPNGPSDANKCPVSHPELTWTDSSNYDKSVYGPATRHVVNGIHHGLYRTVNSAGLDRIHAWTSHDHGFKYAEVTTLPCTQFSCPPDWVAVACSTGGYQAHVHCDTYRDDPYSTGFFNVDPDPGRPPYPSTCYPVTAEGPAPEFHDGHGIACHEMHESVGNDTSPE